MDGKKTPQTIPTTSEARIVHCILRNQDCAVA